MGTPQKRVYPRDRMEYIGVMQISIWDYNLHLGYPEKLSYQSKGTNMDCGIKACFGSGVGLGSFMNNDNSKLL